MIDPTKPFQLKKMIVDRKTGNTYIPHGDRYYSNGELPNHLITVENCLQEAEHLNWTPDMPIGVRTRANRSIEPPIEYQSDTIPTSKLDPWNNASLPSPPSLIAAIKEGDKSAIKPDLEVTPSAMVEIPESDNSETSPKLSDRPKQSGK